VVLGARGQHEREAQPACRRDRCSNSLGRTLQLVEPAGGIVVLDRRTDSPGLGDARDRVRNAPRIGAVAVFEVDRKRQIGRTIERGNVADDLVERRVTV
jgi:hypothetical protein